MGKVRFGVAVVSAIPEMIRTAQLAERLGFDSIWTPDETVGYEMEYGSAATIPDAFGSLTAMALKTKRIQVGSSVADALIRHPAKLAQSAATLDSASKGRFLLGLGASEAGNHEPFGINTENPYQKVREAIEVSRLLWGSGFDKRVNYAGRHYQLKEAYLRIRPARNKGPPIYIAAFGPRMLSLVGELGDGWIPFAHTPESYRKQLDGPVKQGLEKNGRSLADIDPACIVPASISRRDGKSRREAIAIAKTYLVWSYDNMNLIVPGLEHPGIRQTQLKTLDHLSELVRLSKQIPDDVAEELTVSGTPPQCKEQIERFLHAGCRHLILVPIGRNEPDRATKMKMLGKVISRL